MENKRFFHLCGDGSESRNFITSLADYRAAFNLVGVCAANTRVIVISFSHEESHPHFLLWGTEADCLAFKELFETLYRHYTSRTRKKGLELSLDFELYPIESEEYLLNVAAYTVIQPTKDGKPIQGFYSKPQVQRRRVTTIHVRFSRSYNRRPRSTHSLRGYV